MIDNPQNPYESYLVEASAGSGKTWQLSHRFLCLVAAGSKPQHILTITFTVKAAHEMRERILKEAANLAHNKTRQKQFDDQMQSFHHSYSTQLPQPLSAEQTGQLILSSTQLLKITTIDALFHQWNRRFPFETGYRHFTTAHQSSLKMLTASEVQKLDSEAFETLIQQSEQPTKLLKKWHHCFEGIQGLKQRLFELRRYQLNLWSHRARGQQGLATHSTKPAAFSSEKDLVTFLTPSLRLVAMEAKRKDEILEALQDNSIQSLVQAKLLTSAGAVSKSTIRGQKRDKLLEPISHIDQTIREYKNAHRLQHFNDLTQEFQILYDEFDDIRQSLKQKQGAIEFGDLSRGCDQLFQSDSCPAALWLLTQSIDHLMIDEFQDTSHLQWSLFRHFIVEFFSQNTLEDQRLPATAFIVGDRKQSIYGFREADPEVVEFAKKTFETFEKPIRPLNQSYRTTQVILDFVNRVFSHQESFPLHTTAHLDGEKFIPDCGRITILNQEDSAENEAKSVVQWLKKALSGEISHPVYDQKTKTYRALEPKDCCLMYRNTTHIEAFEDELRAHGLPYIREEKKGFFQRREIQDAFAWLTYLTNPADLNALLTVLKSPWVMVADVDILTALEQTKSLEGYHRCLSLLQRLSPSYPEDIAILQEQLQNLPSLCHRVFAHAVPALHLQHKYQKLFVKDAAHLAIQNLQKFLDLCLDVEEQGHTTPQQALRQFQQMMLDDEHGHASTHGNAIRLMTIHKSKGLEFPLVMVTQTAQPWHKTDRYWVKDPQNHKVSYVGTTQDRPDKATLFDSLMERQTVSAHEECWRLLYVALTRSSQYLTISGWEGSRKQPGLRFMETLKDSCQGQPTPWGYAFEHVPEWQHHATTPTKPVQTHIERPFIFSQRWSKQQDVNLLNPHSAIQGLQKEERVVPAHWHPALSAAIGTFVHKIFELQTLGKSYHIDQLWNIMVTQSEAARAQQISTRDNNFLFQRASQDIQKTLTSRFWSRLHTSENKLIPEMNICARMGGELIVGTVDLYCETPDEVWIIDYKSTPYGPPKNRKIISQETDYEDFCTDHGYFEQLSYYQKAAEQFTTKKVRGWIWLTREQVAIENRGSKQTSTDKTESFCHDPIRDLQPPI